MKLVVTAAPLKDYYGFPMVRGRPFYKSTGKNEIIVKSSRDVSCWFYGQEDGLGDVGLLGLEGTAYNADNQYL